MDQVSAIIGGGLPAQLGDHGNAVFGNDQGLAWGARWHRRDDGRLLIDLDPAPLGQGLLPPGPEAVARLAARG